MAAVNVREGIRYGVSLLGYFLILFIGGGVVTAIGFALFGLDNIVATLIGFIFLLVGIVVFYAGFLGVGYKVIADGVERGVRSSQSSVDDPEVGDTTGGGGLIESVTAGTERQSAERSEESRTHE